MPLLVVPLGLDETELLTLREWDALLARDEVLFERIDHPLLARLTDAGVRAGSFDDEPSASDETRALVADPDSARVLDLARAGAELSLGWIAAPDDLTAGHAAVVARRAAASLGRLAAVMARLRSPDGCPWDREQTHESLRVHLVEEAHEVLEAIDSGRVEADLEEELGDLLLQVFFHAQLASDDGRFTVAGVGDRIVAKLLNRHPHVFGDTTVADAAEVVKNWETIKAEEKERVDPFEGIPASLSALLTAYKTQKRAAGLGWAAGEEESLARVHEAVDGADIGEALFWIVALARARGIDPEGALRSAVARFRKSL